MNFDEPSEKLEKIIDRTDSAPLPGRIGPVQCLQSSIEVNELVKKWNPNYKFFPPICFGYYLK